MWLSPACPAAGSVDWKSGSREGHGHNKGRKEGGARRAEKEEGRWSSELQGGSGPLADISELDDPGLVTHQNLSFTICLMGLIPTLYQLSE